MKSGRLFNKVAVVAGGASGIGEAACRAFAREGLAGLAIADINRKSGEALAAEIAASGCPATFEHIDAANEEDWSRLAPRVFERYGHVDILVNCAGVGGPLVRPAVENTEEDAWDRTFAVNAKGALFGMKHFIPVMRSSGGGSIVNVSSVYAIVGPRFATSYAASKGACLALSRTAAIQYAAENIRVNTVLPGYVNTPMTRDIHSQPEVREQRLAETPMGRFAEPHEIALGLLYLASDEASFVTGAELVIDGGMTAR